MTVRRVACVVNVFPKLTETFIAGELAELSRRGVELLVLSLREPQQSGLLRHHAGAELTERTLYDSGRFAAALDRFRPDVVHAHFATEPAAAAASLAQECRVPFTFTAHGYDVYRRPPADWPQRARAASAVITVSGANARHICARAWAAPEHVHVVPCGVDVDRFRPAQTNGRRGAHIVCVARLRPVKNLELLIDACAELRAGGLEFRCTIVGDGSRRAELADAARRLGLQTVVTLVGAQDQEAVLRWWQSATVAALTSHSEGMPVCLMEAAAVGVPAVATAVGGVPELVDDGKTGVLVAPGDRAALVGALSRLIKEPQFATQLGSAARLKAVREYSVQRAVDELLRIWSNLDRRES